MPLTTVPARRLLGSSRPSLRLIRPTFVRPSHVFSAAIARELDQAIEAACSEPYRGLPRVAVLAASSLSPSLYSGVGGYEQIPPSPNDLPRAPKLTEDSIFSLWSCTKLVTIVAVLQLVEKGKVRLDDDASKFVPELRELKLLKKMDEDDNLELVDNDTIVTVEMLVLHTAGFKYEPFDLHMKIAKKLGLSFPYAENATRESLTKAPFIYPPGTRWSYGTATDWLSLVIASASDLSLDAYFQKFIFDPLGIHDMSFTNPPSRISMAHEPSRPGGAYTFGRGKLFTQNVAWGGCGLSGSPKSFLKILWALLRGGEIDGGTRLLEQETIDSMFRNQLTTEQQMSDLREYTKKGIDPWTHKDGKQPGEVAHGYGGVLTGEVLPSGRGKGAMTWSGVANTFWVIDRVNDVAFLIWTNTLPHASPKLFELWEAIEPKLYAGLPSAPK
ncbi:hypothetical protein JCM21900_005036 [Sporobolomyces salmonicolor]